MEPTDVSESKRGEIDSEVRRIVSACEKTTMEILKAERKAMDRIVKDLMKNESLEREDFEKIVGVTKEEVKKANKYRVNYS